MIDASAAINLIPVAALVLGIPGVFATDAIFNRNAGEAVDSDIRDEKFVQDNSDENL